MKSTPVWSVILINFNFLVNAFIHYLLTSFYFRAFFTLKELIKNRTFDEEAGDRFEKISEQT